MRGRPLRPSIRTLILCFLGVFAGTAQTAIVIVTARGSTTIARENAARAVPAQAALHRAWVAGVDGQGTLMGFVQTPDPMARAVALIRMQRDAQAQSAAWSAYRAHALGRPGESALQQSFDAAGVRTAKLVTDLLAMSPTDPALAKAVAQERAEYEKSIAALATLDSTIYAPAVESHAATFISALTDLRRNAYLGFISLAGAFAVVGVWLMRGARKEEQAMRLSEITSDATARFAHFDTSLQRALDMERNEETLFPVIAQALKGVDPEVPSELLLADSSHSHFRQVLTTDPEADAACGVESPEACPATITGQTQFFEDSSTIDACPYLRGRDDHVWATCVPISISGRSTGVMHAQGPVTRPRGDVLRSWELIGRKLGERIGMLRAFARSEIQAETDPLTGLLNRRSLEKRVRRLDDDGASFVVAYADLDHFKLLNDVHGHDAGDRALGVFARVLRDNVRPDDIACRFGGEEFVVVLPKCSIDDATAVVDRVRDQLRVAIANGALPAFTVSVGLAASEIGLTFAEVLGAADKALLHAKSTGRDRIVVDRAEVPNDEVPVIAAE